MSESATVTGFTGAWLAARRDELNARFRAARRRFTKLDAQTVLALNAELLPPLAGDGEQGADELLSEIFDLIVLHAGRGLLTSGPSPFRTLLTETFLRTRALLLQRPRLLPSALSNAVENLGAKGEAFARGLSAMAPQLQSADHLREAGAVLAWRLGEARLRDYALNAAGQLPPAAALSALGLSGWPAAAAPLALAALLGDAWCHPLERIRPQTLLQLTAAPREKMDAALEALSAPPPAAAAWRACGTCGEFAGFDGYFLEPPKLLDAGKLAGRHRFWVRSGTTNYRIDADLFGWVCKPDAAADWPIQETARRSGVGSRSVSGLKGTDTMLLFNDGALFSRGKLEQIADLPLASSFLAGEQMFAATQFDSFRIRVFTLARAAL